MPSGRPLPPTTTRAPSSWPRAMYFSTRSCWRSATSGPISVAGSSGSPTFMPRTVVAEGVDDLVVVRRATARMRVWATQAWPLFISEANFRPSIVAARSASSRMMAADLPPSSRLTRLSCSPQIEAMVRPAAVEPVKAILSTPGWRTRCSPTSRPAGTTLTTPFGMPASSRSSAMSMASSGVSGDGLITMVEPDEQRRGQLRHRDELGDVPRHDGADHADGLAAHDDRASRACRRAPPPSRTSRPRR